MTDRQTKRTICIFCGRFPWLVARWLTGKIMKGGGYGFFVDIILGIVGGLVGIIARGLGFPPRADSMYTLIIATAGAVIVVILFRLITGKRS